MSYNSILVCTTKLKRHTFRDSALNSIITTLPKDWKLEVYIDNGIGLVKNKINALTNTSGKLVAFVDDDDILLPGILNKCTEAIKLTNAGIAFSRQERITELGLTFSRQIYQPKKYAQVVNSVYTIHHLAVFNPKDIPQSLFDLAIELNHSIDWLVKGWVALNKGAVAIPEVGYQWRKRKGQASSFSAPSSKIIEYLKATATVDLTSEIPTYYGSNSIPR